ncbi:hypothetical protein EEB14_55615 [Rhodococcus sp. WS4]|nr:hypothetical protein EEB14_55615 [Rhodococcus sp. WS4]
MGIAALITWLLTAVGGFYMLSVWIAKGGPRRPSASHFPPALIFGHLALAVVGLVLWIIYLLTDTDALAWVAFIVLLPVAALGFTMLVRWIPSYRARAAVTATAPGATAGAATEQVPAEKHFPVVVVAGHGLFAVVTVVLVLLTALGVGGS